MRVRWQALGLAVGMCFVGAGAYAQDAAKTSSGGALSERDGSVRARAGLRLAVSHAPNPAGDQAVKIGRRVQPHMASIRECYQKAVHRDARLEGQVVVRLANVPRGGRKAVAERNATGDERFERCIMRALASVRLRGLPTHAAAHVEVRVTAPGSTVKHEMRMRTARARRVQVKRSRGGQVQSEGGTQGGEVKFALQAPANERASLVALHQEVADRLAGLLDCRRRATRRGVTPRGELVFDVHTQSDGVDRVRTVTNRTRDPRASRCVEDWLKRAQANGGGMPSGQVRLTLSYGP